MLSKTKGFLSGKAWIRISGENNLTPQNETNLTCVPFLFFFFNIISFYCLFISSIGFKPFLFYALRLWYLLLLFYIFVAVTNSGIDG